jgi:hypothetical protein
MASQIRILAMSFMRSGGLAERLAAAPEETPNRDDVNRYLALGYELARKLILAAIFVTFPGL